MATAKSDDIGNKLEQFELYDYYYYSDKLGREARLFQYNLRSDNTVRVMLVKMEDSHRPVSVDEVIRWGANLVYKLVPRSTVWCVKHDVGDWEEIRGEWTRDDDTEEWSVINVMHLPRSEAWVTEKLGGRVPFA